MMNKRQENLFDSIKRIEAIKRLRDRGIITQRDYWLLTGNYRIVGCGNRACKWEEKTE